MQAIAMILGEQPAPWEDEGSSQLLQKLGPFRRAVLLMLSRDPAARPSMADFLQACRLVLSSTTTG